MTTAGKPTSQRVAWVAATSSVVAGGLVLAGELIQVTALTSIFPGLHPISVSLAAALMLAGLSLGLRVRRPDDRRARLAATVLAAGATVTGVRLALGDADGSNAAGLAVALGGLSLAALGSERTSRAHSFLVPLMGLVVLVSMAGFAVDPARFTETSRTTGIGFISLLLLAVLCVGSAALRPERGLAALLFPDGSRKGLAWLAWSVILIPSIGLAALAVALFAVVTVAVDAARNRYYKVDSDRRRAIRNLKTREERLREAQKRYKGLLEAAPDAMVVVRANGRIALANENAQEVFGHSREALIGRQLEELIPSRFRSAHRDHRAGFMEDPHTRPMGAGLDLWALRADGTEFPVEISLSVTQTEDEGKLVTAAIRDITARRQAEATLRQTEQRFRSAFEDAPIGMAITATDGRFNRVNKALCEITGYSRGQLEATSFASITDPGDLESYRDAVTRMLAGRIDNYRGEQKLIHTDGQPIPIELTTTLIRSGDEDDPSHFLVQVQDITDRKRFEGQLQYLADHDALTGLFNRRRFDEELEREIARARREGAECCVLALDLDNFKYLNDSLGHSVGDELITRISHLLREQIRETDVLARLGGDEFALILPNTDAVGAERLAAQLLEVVKTGAEVQVGRSSTRLTVSIGIAPILPESRATAEEAMVEADIAMYDAKEAGRDRAAVFEASKDRQRTMEARLTWVQRIREAIDGDGFALYAQPILGLDGDVRPRHELLLRMRGRTGT